MSGLVRGADGIVVATEDLGGGSDGEFETVGNTEEWCFETTVDFDSIAQTFNGVSVLLSGTAEVDSGGTYTLRVRAGGTPGETDGTLILEVGPFANTTPEGRRVIKTAYRPAGVLPVKVTLHCPENAKKARASGLDVTVRGA